MADGILILIENLSDTKIRYTKNINILEDSLLGSSGSIYSRLLASILSYKLLLDKCILKN